MTPHLAYTVAFDMAQSRSSRIMAKLLVSSLLKTSFPGDIVVFKNFRSPLLAVRRVGLREVVIETPPWAEPEDDSECLLESLAWRFRAREAIDPSPYDKILYLDADCLALRTLDHLLAGVWDIAYQPERGRPVREKVFNGYLRDDELTARDGVNAGTFAIRSELWSSVLEEWERIYLSAPTRHPEFRDQTSWNRLLLDASLRAVPFERGEIALPFAPGIRYRHYREAALVHMVGEDSELKVDLAYALYMTKFYRDPAGLFLNFLEV